MILAHDIKAIASKLSRQGRGQSFASLNSLSVGVARFSAHPLWERHPDADELLQVFEGELDLTILAEEGPVETALRPGSIIIVPRGLWHSLRPRGTVTMLFVNDPSGTEVSNKKDPRTSG